MAHFVFKCNKEDYLSLSAAYKCIHHTRHTQIPTYSVLATPGEAIITVTVTITATAAATATATASDTVTDTATLTVSVAATVTLMDMACVTAAVTVYSNYITLHETA
jgi:hypothetical protein